LGEGKFEKERKKRKRGEKKKVPHKLAGAKGSGEHHMSQWAKDAMTPESFKLVQNCSSHSAT
jgi:hypothetical protein